jgi:hypothetical protein
MAVKNRLNPYGKSNKGALFCSAQKVSYKTAQPNGGCVGQGMEGE